MAPVDDATWTVIMGLLIIAPFLLLAVFLGALTVGRRVATPIERARLRQLAFTADASHELRTPLSVIEANASLALATEREAAWYRRSFERVLAEAQRMHRLVDDLLWLARFDATQQPPAGEPVDLGVMVEQAADRFAVLAETRAQRIDVEVDDLDASLSAPPEWIDQLIAVLLDNACKYSPEGGRIVVRVARNAGRVALSVDDSGPGISDDEMESLFDRFHRGTHDTAGAGLGLAIGDAIVRATSGLWDIRRSELGGAHLTVSWPGPAQPA
jgi:two-component system OmpR family sensor kinase